MPTIPQFTNSFLQPVQQQGQNLLSDFSQSALGNAMQGKWGNVASAAGNELQGIGNGKIPVSFGAETEDVTPENVNYAARTLDPGTTGKITQFVNHVNEHGSQSIHPFSNEVQDVARDIWGRSSDVVTSGNQRLANAFDTLLGQIGKKWNSAGVYR